ncbi:MAG: GLUG motif-containing protein, partial [Bacillota bacterium]
GDFDLIRNDLSGHFKLINDIQLTGNWEPIGQDTDGKSPFSGTFDGQGFTISDLIIGNNDLPEGYNAGFFGHTSGATIKNVNLREVDVSGSGNVGTLAGKAKNTIVENCTVSGTVQGSGNNVGGLVGQAANVSITNSSVSGEVSGDANMVGGLVGNMTDYNYSTEAKISFSFADAEVSGNQGVGGLVGSTQSKSNINDSYATGMVEGDCCIGGLAGGVFKDTSIKNCYSSSTVNLTNQSAANTGGLAGYAHPETIDQNNYWNICQSGLAESALGTGNTNEQMMRASSFEKWDFEQTWHIREGSGSPILKWQLEHENSNDNEQSGQENEKGDYRSPKKLFSSGFFMFAMDYSPCLSLNIETAVDLILAKLEKVDLLLEVMLDKEKVDLEELNLAMGLLEEVRGLLTRYADQLEDIEHLQLSEKVEEQMNLVAGLIAAN